MNFKKIVQVNGLMSIGVDILEGGIFPFLHPTDHCSFAYTCTELYFISGFIQPSNTLAWDKHIHLTKKVTSAKLELVATVMQTTSLRIDDCMATNLVSLARMKRLTCLNISSSIGQPEGFDWDLGIRDICAGVPGLLDLTIIGDVTDVGVQIIGIGLQNLQHLSLTGCWQVTSAAMLSLKRLTYLKSLELLLPDNVPAQHVQCLTGMSSLTKLNLSSSYIEDDALVKIAHLKIQELYIQVEGAYGEDGLRAISKMPIRLLSIMHRGNGGGCRRVSEYFNCLGSTLIDLSLDGNTSLTDEDVFRLYLPLLTVLNLDGCQLLTDKCLRADVILRGRLQHLSLCNNRHIGDVGVSQLADHRTLRVLRLSSTSISDSCLPVFFTIPNLKYLAVTWCMNVSMYGQLENFARSLSLKCTLKCCC